MNNCPHCGTLIAAGGPTTNTYFNIGHKKADNIVWIHDGKRIQKRTGISHELHEQSDALLRGQINTKQKIGSITWGDELAARKLNDEKLAKILKPMIEDVLVEFPGIKFEFFHDFNAVGLPSGKSMSIKEFYEEFLGKSRNGKKSQTKDDGRSFKKTKRLSDTIKRLQKAMS